MQSLISGLVAYYFIFENMSETSQEKILVFKKKPWFKKKTGFSRFHIVFAQGRN